jgi:hypothetical protein
MATFVGKERYYVRCGQTLSSRRETSPKHFRPPQGARREPLHSNDSAARLSICTATFDRSNRARNHVVIHEHSRSRIRINETEKLEPSLPPQQSSLIVRRRLSTRGRILLLGAGVVALFIGGFVWKRHLEAAPPAPRTQIKKLSRSCLSNHE